MKIIWSPLAVDRVAEIAQYISSDNPTAARNWIKTVFAEVELLKSSPKIGRIVPELKQEDFREVILGNYRIIYRVEKKSVSILTIRHGKQILPVEELSTSQ
ncbi:MAG: type II toxin-antitoxin system RelE/ParE family toxin [Candidatus Electrothrix sp. AR5]|nr:type II toxin-antitoxin system RelE/ParE family toxin [Candidatus Electrothrix sp. AR5]